MVTQIPGGVLAERFGGKNVFLYPMLIAALSTVLCPLAAKLHVVVFMAVRVVIGLCQGVVFPAMHSIWSQWAPPLERTKLTSITYSGAQIGNVITIPLAAFLCYYVSWEAVFYVFGLFGFVWCFFWFLIASNSPNECKRISRAEQSYINSCLVGQVKQRKTTVESNNELRKPWLKFLKSGPVWAIVITHTCTNFGTNLVLTSLPSFMSEVLHLDIKSNGLLSALPYVAFWAGINFAGFMADFLIRKKILSTTKTRKLHMLISQFGQAGALIGVGYCEPGQKILAVALLTLSQGLNGLQYGGYIVNHVDIAPRFAGTLFGISNTVATISGIVAPFIAASLTPNKTILQWRLVFIITGAILIFGSLFYALLGSGELQLWAEIPTEAGSEQTETQRGGRAEENLEGKSNRTSL
uniref:Major facilitator superfamily (MFS) profile domain-containing protein n=1 Tax=Plectus sambesii TaxID=2011161 RepID=A0A914WUR0_9BILA